MRSLSSRSIDDMTGSLFPATFPDWTAIWHAKPARTSGAGSPGWFVCTTDDTDAVLGFYALSVLSVDRSARRRCIGRVLVADAVMLTVAAGETVAMYALIVDDANQGPGLPDAVEAFLRARPP